MYGTLNGRRYVVVAGMTDSTEVYEKITLCDLETDDLISVKAYRLTVAKTVNSPQYVILANGNLYCGDGFYCEIVEMAKRYPTFKIAVSAKEKLKKNNLFVQQLDDLINWNDGKGWLLK